MLLLQRKTEHDLLPGKPFNWLAWGYGQGSCSVALEWIAKHPGATWSDMDKRHRRWTSWVEDRLRCGQGPRLVGNKLHPVYGRWGPVPTLMQFKTRTWL